MAIDPMEKRLCVIIPTYNNAGTILQVVQSVMAYCNQLIVVDDGCTDGTSDILNTIPLLVKENEKSPSSIIVGCRNLTEENMPRQNTFANRFSNFWFRLQTGVNLSDTQSGYRLYPLASLRGLSLITSRYEAELELLVYASWAGVQIKSVPVKVYYPPAEERVSHFRPIYDFVRISILNTILCIAALFYGYPRRLARSMKRMIS